jgi:hypothetical protein
VAAKVIHLNGRGRGNPRSCFDCVHFDELIDDDGVQSYCTAYEEVIDSEAYNAEDCPIYERSGVQ